VNLKPILDKAGASEEPRATLLPRGTDNQCDLSCCYVIGKPTHIGLNTRREGHFPHLPDPAVVDVLVHHSPRGAGYLYAKPDAHASGGTKATVHRPLPGEASYPIKSVTKVGIAQLEFIVDRDTLLLILSKAHTIMGIRRRLRPTTAWSATRSRLSRSSWSMCVPAG